MATILSALQQKKTFRLSDLRQIENVREHEREIVRWLESSRNLEKVVLNEPLAISDEAVTSSIREAVFRNKYIKDLRIGHAKLLHQRGIHLMKSLEKLHVSFTSVEAETSIIAQLLRTHTKGLQELILEGIRVGDVEAQAVARSLRFRSSLRKVKLSGRGMTNDGFIALGEALQLHSSLVEVEVRQYEFVLNADVEVWAQAIERNTSLEKLILLLHRMTAPCASTILHAMATNQTLKEVRLGNLELDGEGSIAAARVITENDTLDRLSLFGTFRHGMDDKGTFYEQGMDFEPIAQALASNNSLKHFSFMGWGLRADGIRSVSHALLQNNTLEGLGFGFNHMDTQGVVPFCLLISQNTTLKYLTLNSCTIDDELLKILCKALEHNHSLESLCLPDNRIGDKGVSALAGVLSGNTSLKELSIGQNSISDVGCVSLGRALHQNSTLTRLKMSSNQSITERGTRALLDGVRVHPTLTRVELPLTPNDSQKKELGFYLDRNKGPMPLLNANIPLGLWPRALQRANNYGSPDMLYFLVKEKSEELFQNMTGIRKQKATRRGRTSKRKRKWTDESVTHKP